MPRPRESKLVKGRTRKADRDSRRQSLRELNDEARRLADEAIVRSSKGLTKRRMAA